MVYSTRVDWPIQAGHVSIAEYLQEQTIVINGLSGLRTMTGWPVEAVFIQQFSAQLVQSRQYLVAAANTVTSLPALKLWAVGKDDAEPAEGWYLSSVAIISMRKWLS